MASSGLYKHDIKEEDRFIALLLTESFDSNFEPLIKNDPLAFLPVANNPLFDYSLDWLQRCEVNETIVYCCAQPHADRIREHCKQWNARHGNFMNVLVISSENCTSLGDAMRDLYSKSLLKKDFILLTVDVVGNLDLKNLMERHKTVRKEDPSAVMTCVYINSERRKKRLDECREVNLIVNSRTGKIIVHSRPRKSSKITLPVETLQMASKFRILSQIDDPGISICSEVIPSLFSDNFDYGTRDSLVQGIIEQEELLGYSIHAMVLEDGYASRISTFRAYQDVSEALIRRSNFPSVPERSLSSHRIRYLFHPVSGSYWDSSAKFHKKSIGSYVAIDAGTDIDHRSRIQNSVIGKHCIIKENVSIVDSFIGSNVIISQGCILDCCYVGNDVKLLPGVHLEPGVVVGPNVILGPNVKVNRSSRLMSHPPVDPVSGQQTTAAVSTIICGREGEAYLYEREDIEQGSTIEWGASLKEVIDECDSTGSDINSSDDDDDDLNKNQGEEEGAISDSERAEQEFIKEVNDSLLNGWNENSAAENIILEINSSRHAYNVTVEDVLVVVTKGILQVGTNFVETKSTGEEFWNAINKGLYMFADVLRNYIRKPKDQITVLRAIEDAVNKDQRFLPLIQKTLYELNQELEILDDEVITYWYSKGGTTPIFPAIAKCIAKFVAWLSENEDSEED